MLHKHVNSTVTHPTAPAEDHQNKQAENHPHTSAISFFHHWLMVGKKHEMSRCQKKILAVIVKMREDLKFYTELLATC